MNIIFLNANIKIVLTIIVIIYIFLIFPVFVRIEGVFDNDTKKLKYKIKLFKYITVLFGYVELIDVGIAVHVNNLKAFIIYYKDIFSIRKKFKPLKDYHIYRLNSVVNLGSENNYENVICISIIYNAFVNIMGYTLNIIKPYVKVKNDINIYKKESVFNVNFNFVVVFNVLMVILSIAKIYTEKIIYALKKQ